MTTPTNTSTNVRDLTMGADGTRLGQTTTDLISFYGATPVAQSSGNAQAALVRGQQGGLVVTFSMTKSPASVATLTTAEQSFTPIGGTGATVSIATTDLVYLNKPTAQAGLLNGNVRASAANTVGVSFGNVTTGFLTPTASETYGVVAIKGGPQQVVTPAAATFTAGVPASSTTEFQIPVTGIRVGDVVQVNKPTVQAGLEIVGTRAVSNNVLGITFMNLTSGVLTPTVSEAYTVISLGGIDASSNYLTYQVSVASLASAGVTAASTGSYNLTVTNMALTDSFVGWNKPTNQSGIGIAGGKISSAGVAAVFIGNYTSGTVVTPTASEVYSLETLRPAPVAPMVVYSQTLTPASIVTLTTAEQTFTVTGLISLSPVWVNGPAQPAGVGIGGVRVSATNIVGINFVNITSATLTPTSGTYYIANFQMPVDAPGNSILQPASFVTDQVRALSNALRAALVGNGMIAGA
jgi:hypothetical protein